MMDNDDDEELPKVILPTINMKSEIEAYLAEVLHVDSPGLFYIRLFEIKDYYTQFAENLNQSYKDGDSLLGAVDYLPIGSHWCVYSDDDWYRAKVSGNAKHKKPEDPLHLEMLLVDVGVTRIISINDVHKLKQEFTFDPPLAIPCCLSKVYPRSPLQHEPWTNVEIGEFIEFCLSTMLFTAIFVRKALNNLFEVILESSDGIVINERMANDKSTSQKLDDFIISSSIVQDINKEAPPASPEVPSPLLEWDPMAEDFKSSMQLDSECASTMFLGIKNEDEKIICKFYREGRSCPRGDVCRWKHIKPRQDGLPSNFRLIHSQIQKSFDLPEEGSILSVIVTVVFSPSVFFVQFPDKDATFASSLSGLQQAMNAYYKKSSPNLGLGTLLPSCGELMAVNNPRSPLKGWHRVRVLQLSGIDDDISVQVVYIDLGIEEWVHESHLRPIAPEFLQLPIQAVECWLFGLKTEDGIWKSDSTNHFCQFINDKILIAEVAATDNVSERLGLIILDNSNDNYFVLNDDMITRGLALPKEDDSSEEDASGQEEGEGFVMST